MPQLDPYSMFSQYFCLLITFIIFYFIFIKFILSILLLVIKIKIMLDNFLKFNIFNLKKKNLIFLNNILIS